MSQLLAGRRESSDPPLPNLTSARSRRRSGADAAGGARRDRALPAGFVAVARKRQRVGVRTAAAGAAGALWLAPEAAEAVFFRACLGCLVGLGFSAERPPDDVEKSPTGIFRTTIRKKIGTQPSTGSQSSPARQGLVAESSPGPVAGSRPPGRRSGPPRMRSARGGSARFAPPPTRGSSRRASRRSRRAAARAANSSRASSFQCAVPKRARPPKVRTGDVVARPSRWGRWSFARSSQPVAQTISK